MKTGITSTLLALFFLLQASFGFAAGDVYTVTTSVVQNMVSDSSQELTLTLKNQTSKTVDVHCAIEINNQQVVYSFNNNGCTSAGGLGLPPMGSAPVLLTLKVPSGVSGSLSATVIFSQTNGRAPLPPPKKVPLNITVKPNSNRVISFENYCPFDVYLGMTSGSAPAKNTGTIPCSSDEQCSMYTYSSCVNGACGGGACNTDSECAQNDGGGNYTGTCKQPAAGKPSSCTICYVDADCISGSSCDTNTNQCYWDMPAPAGNNYKLAAYTSGTPASNSVSITDRSTENGYTLIWTGRAAGRTGCQLMGTAPNQYYSCQTATCNDATHTGDGLGGCGLAQSFAAPSTLLEFALVATTPDTYDVSMVNGISIPATMAPASLSGIGTPQAYGNPFVCANAGSIQQTNTSNGNLGGCSWNFSSPSVAFRLVDETNGSSCSTDEYCQGLESHLRCGQTAANAAATTTTATLTCGLPLGYWNQNQLCTTTLGTYNVTGIVNCPGNAGGGNTVYNLLQGTGNGATSCYNVGSSTNTCTGCTNWQKQGVIMPNDSKIVQQCEYPNANWGAGAYPNETGAVLPGITWFKRACPSAYSYVFDDKASTFGCPAHNGQSAVNYKITFCPGGKTAGSVGGPSVA